MDQKMQNKENMGEETRKVLNKSIDILHKLSKGKTTRKEGRQELSALLAGHFLSTHKPNEGIDINQKVKLQCYLDEALDIIDKIDSGKAPLYEGILLMNKVIVKKKSVEETVPLDEKAISPVFEEVKIAPLAPKEDPPMIHEQFDRSGTQKEAELIKAVKMENHAKSSKMSHTQYSQMGIQELMQEVLKNKELFEKSVLNLNESLLEVGFELRMVETKS